MCSCILFELQKKTLISLQMHLEKRVLLTDFEIKNDIPVCSHAHMHT